MKNILFIGVFILIVCSCEKTVTDFEIKRPKDKLNVIGLFSSDSIARVYVRHRTEGSSSDSFPSVTDASVELFKNGISVGQFTLNAGDKEIYTLNYVFEPGSDYRLRATASGFEEVSSSFSIPEKPEVTYFDTNIVLTRFPDCPECSPIIGIEFELTFKNAPEVEEYYTIQVFQKGNCDDFHPDDYYSPCDDTSGVYTDEMQLFTHFPNVEAVTWEMDYQLVSPEEEAYGNKLIFSNKNQKGDVINLSVVSFPAQMFYNVDASYALVLSKVDKNYYNYVISKGKNQNSEGNPFVQPVSIFSNVENGIGLVTGISRKEFSVSIPDSLLYR